jgi:hypothetical protein
MEIVFWRQVQYKKQLQEKIKTDIKDRRKRETDTLRVKFKHNY